MASEPQSKSIHTTHKAKRLRVNGTRYTLVGPSGTTLRVVVMARANGLIVLREVSR